MKLLLNITHGFQARMLLRTAIAERLLAARAELVVVAPNADEAYFQSELDRPGIRLERMPNRYPKVEKAVVNTRAYFLMNPSLGATLNHKRDRYRRTYPVRYYVTRVGNVVLGNVPLLRRAYLAAEERIFDGSEFDELIARHAPDLVVAGTPGFNTMDAHVIRAARRAGVPSATVMLSWDNLTSKGYMAAQPDYLLVWSDLMRDEALRYHDFEGPIVEVGAAQFDVYERVRRELDVVAHKQELGLEPGKRLVVWGTINNAIYPNQHELLRRFVQTLRQRPDWADIHLWIRIHPQTIFGPFKDVARDYEALRGDQVTVEFPKVQSERLPWDLPKSDMWHLAALMRAADIVITPQSTLTLDAAAVGTPIINLAVDPVFARTYRYTHYLNVLKHQGVWLAKTYDELCSAVDRYSAEPELHASGREAIVAEQMGRWFGQAGERTARALLGIARGEPATEIDAERPASADERAAPAPAPAGVARVGTDRDVGSPAISGRGPANASR